ncbi:MAG TPA: PHP domain-containing protein [Clostridiales bacterium]|nr:PHP domain-containing protein [Clostridiales bacterium]
MQENYPYKLELHTHTSPISPCSAISGADLAKEVAAAGYHLLHVTDHLRIDTFNLSAEREAEIDRFLNGYYKAKEVGEKLGLTVLYGAELSLTMLNNEYLLFGMNREFFRALDNVFSLRPAELLSFAHTYGIVVVQAHPFRSYMVRTGPADVDGIEGYNLHPNHNSRNEQAMAYAKKYDLIATSGTDVHHPTHVGRGGIRSKVLPKTEAELATLIRSRDYQLIY